MGKHPFQPLISPVTRKLLIGTLPPEDVKFYFSNSSNTRLWDLLYAISQKTNEVGTGGNNYSNSKKVKILDSLRVGISDIIYQYERDEYYSTKDTHIHPKEYKNILQVAIDNNIDELLFVYQSAYKWFIHSLGTADPVRLKMLKGKYSFGPQPTIDFQGRTINCILLPPPLNRGGKGQTLAFKLEFYKKYILGQ